MQTRAPEGRAARFGRSHRALQAPPALGGCCPKAREGGSPADRFMGFRSATGTARCRPRVPSSPTASGGTGACRDLDTGALAGTRVGMGMPTYDLNGVSQRNRHGTVSSLVPFEPDGKWRPQGMSRPPCGSPDGHPCRHGDADLRFAISMEMPTYDRGSPWDGDAWRLSARGYRRVSDRRGDKFRSAGLSRLWLARCEPYAQGHRRDSATPPIV